MRSKVANLGEKEWAIMKVCWDKGQSTARMIHEEIIQDDRRSYITTKTMMDRLVDKGFLAREKLGPVYLYTPAVSQKEVTSNAIDEFLHTVLDDKVLPIFQFAVRKDKYKPEVDQIKEMIEGK